MTQDELWEVAGVTVEQLLEDYDRERAQSYRLAGHHTGHGVGKVAQHSERLAQAQRQEAARTKLLAALNTRATPPAPAEPARYGWTFYGPDGEWHWSEQPDHHESVTDLRAATPAEAQFALRARSQRGTDNG